jgi:hypothetical protein
LIDFKEKQKQINGTKRMKGIIATRDKGLAATVFECVFFKMSALIWSLSFVPLPDGKAIGDLDLSPPDCQRDPRGRSVVAKASSENSKNQRRKPQRGFETDCLEQLVQSRGATKRA